MLCCALGRSQDSLDNDLQLFLVAPQLVLNQIHHCLSQRVLGLAKRLTHEPFLQPRTPGLTHLHHATDCPISTRLQTAPSPPHYRLPHLHHTTDCPISTTLQTAPSPPRYRLPHLHHATDCPISTTLQTAPSPPHYRLPHLHHTTDCPISTTLQTAPSPPRYRLPHLHHATDCPISTTLQTALSFSYAGPSVWNNLPQTLCHSNSTSSFRAVLKTHLFNNYF